MVVTYALYSHKFFIFIYSLSDNSIGDTGVYALEEGLTNCTNMEELR